LAHINSKGVSLIDWNVRGRLVYEGVVLNGTSIGELVHDLLSHTKKKSTGYSKFHKALVKIKLPTSLLKPYTKKSKPKAKANANASKKPDSTDVVNNVKNKWLSY
jgi:hypothetical protein